MKNFILSIFVLSSFLSIYSQNSIDALRYSRMQHLGTARFNGMGGSMGALGGEISSLQVNPGGIGVYRNSEFTFSPSFNLINSETNYLNSNRSDSKLNFNIGNIGYVGSYKGDPNGWKNYSFAISHNRTSNFNSQYRAFGESFDGSSIIDAYVNDLNFNNANVTEVESYAYPFGPSQAYWLFLIDPLSSVSYARNPDINQSSAIEKSQSIETSGRQSETSFTFGGNFQDRLFLGGSIGFQTLRYEQLRNYNEQYIYDPVAQPIDSLAKEYSEQTELIVSGSGINVKLGAIYRVNDAVRVGGAIHSPTFLGFTEEFRFDTESRFSDGDVLTEETVQSDFNYQIRTPIRYIGSFAYLFQQIAAFNIEYEYVDYTNSRFNDSRGFDFDFSETNQNIGLILNESHNIRAGVEVKLSPFVVRGGFRYEDNPFSNQLAERPNESRKTYSIGGGFRQKNYNIDLTYSLTKFQSVDNLYRGAENFAVTDFNESNLFITVGWKW